MSDYKPIKAGWPVAGVCLALSGFGLSAVPFVGTRYGDWPEAIALAIGLLPLVYLGIDVCTRVHRRLLNLEEKLARLEPTRH